MNNVKEVTNVTAKSLLQDILQSRMEHDAAISSNIVERQSVKEDHCGDPDGLSLQAKYTR